MCKLDNQAAAAFKEGRNFKRSSRKVVTCDKTVQYYLHGNLIAERKNGRVWFSLAGCNTRLTRKVLNSLGCEVQQRHFKPILNGKEWWADGDYHK